MGFILAPELAKLLASRLDRTDRAGSARTGKDEFFVGQRAGGAFDANATLGPGDCSA
jgi:hypothetical protein